MKNIPTVEEFLKIKECRVFSNGEVRDISISDILEFTKLHVEAALKNAYDCGSFKGWAISDDENVHKEIFVKNIMSRQAIK